MEPSIRMRIIYSVRYRYAIHFKFGDKFLTSLTKFSVRSERQYLVYNKKIYFYIV